MYPISFHADARDFNALATRDTRSVGRSGRGFTLVELLIVIAVIVILVALLVPAIGMTRAKARQAQCASRQAQIWHAWTQANNQKQPVRGSQWDSRLKAYLSDEIAVLVCPDDVTRSQPSSYGFNAHAWRFVADDAGRIVLFDSKQMEALIVGRSAAQLEVEWPAQYDARHFKRVNVMFSDGHGGSYEPAKIDPKYCDYFIRYWRPQADSNVAPSGCGNSGEPAPVFPVAAATTSSGTGAAATTGGSATTTTTTTGGTTATTTTSTTTTTGAATTTSTSTSGTTTGGPPPNCDKCVDGPTFITGLIVRYTFNDPGAIGNDTSGNNFHSLNVRNINHDPTQRCGAVAMIDRTSQVGMPAAVMNTIIANQKITVAYWFRLTGVSGWISGHVYGTNAGGSRTFNIHLPASYNSSSSTYQSMWDCGAGDRLEEPPWNEDGCGAMTPCSRRGTSGCGGFFSNFQTLNQGQWVHWAFTKDAPTGLMQAYRNGVLYNTSESAEYLAYFARSCNPARLNRAIDAVSNLSVFNDQYLTLGWLDDFQIYNRVLTAQEIQCLATP